MNPILECKGLTRKFNHFFALSNVDLTLERERSSACLDQTEAERRL